MIDLKVIKARADAATPGEWGRYDREDYGEILCCDKGGEYQSISLVQKTFDADFIAHAREDIPALIAEVERLRSGNQQKEQALTSAIETAKINKTHAEQAEAERDAAVEDMKLIADTYREVVGDDGICGLCEFDADHGLDGYANECPGFESNKCFKWRGERSE